MKEITENNTAEIVIVTEFCKEKLIQETEKELLNKSYIKQLASKIRISK